MNIIKKYILGGLAMSVIGAGSLFAGVPVVDEDQFSVGFQAYKTADKQPVVGVFKTVKIKFNKDKSSLKAQLEGAEALLDPKDIDMGDNGGLITANVRDVFFGVLNNKLSFLAEVESITMGKDRGVMTLRISIGKKYNIVQLNYTLKNGELIGTGQLDLNAYLNSQKALKALTDVAPEHEGVVWPIVDVVFRSKVIDSDELAAKVAAAKEEKMLAKQRAKMEKEEKAKAEAGVADEEANDKAEAKRKAKEEKAAAKAAAKAAKAAKKNENNEETEEE